MIKKPDFSGTKVCDARIPKTATLTGWRFYSVFGVIFGFVGLMLYPVVVDPVFHVDKYRDAHKRIQTELFQAGLLPGQLKRWEDPSSKEKK